MQVTLLANAVWLDEELAAFRYLTVGLIDEQVRVAQVVPEHLPVEDAIPFGERVPWTDSTWAWLRRRRIAGLVDVLDKIEPDVIHIMHFALWEGGLELAEELECSAVLHISGEKDLNHAARYKTSLDSNRVAFAVTTGPIAKSLKEMLPGDFMQSLVPPGVHLPELKQKPADREQPLCAIISGAHRHDANYESLFAAIRKLIDDHPDAQFFLDAPTESDHAIWQSARKHGLLANLSMVPHRLGHRELEMAADVVIHPQALHRSRSLTLQAMAHGVPVIAHTDPLLDYLIDDKTAWLIDKPDASRWYEMLRHLIVAPDQGESLGHRARAWVGKNHLASRQVSETIDLYRKVTGEAMKFPG